MERLDEIVELFKPMMSRYDELGKGDHICIFQNDLSTAEEFVDTLEESGLPAEIFQSGAYVRVTAK